MGRWANFVGPSSAVRSDPPRKEGFEHSEHIEQHRETEKIRHVVVREEPSEPPSSKRVQNVQNVQKSDGSQGSGDSASALEGHAGAELITPMSWYERAASLRTGEPKYDEPFAPRRARLEERNGVLIHFCVVCGAWGMFGYGVNLLSGQLGRWYCRAHRPNDGKE
jgi:hypothetical protein